MMIYVSGSGDIVCSNNNIGGISLNFFGPVFHNFYGILASMSGSATFTCQNNIIGGTTGNSINAESVHINSHCYGIYANNPASNITGNTIRNMTAAGGTGTNLQAIHLLMISQILI